MTNYLKNSDLYKYNSKIKLFNTDYFINEIQINNTVNLGSEDESKIQYEYILNQKDATCYAHAVAAAIRNSLIRIKGRYVPPHIELVNEIVEKYGDEGCSVAEVLEDELYERSLDYESLSKVEDVITALNEKRIIVAGFSLNEKQWKNFGSFYDDPNSCSSVLKKNNIGRGDSWSKHEGHAVAIVGYGYTEGKLYFKIRNSWGNDWGDKGYFRMEYDAIKGIKYYDVFFKLNNLTNKDKINFKYYNKWYKRNDLTLFLIIKITKDIEICIYDLKIKSKLMNTILWNVIAKILEEYSKVGKLAKRNWKKFLRKYVLLFELQNKMIQIIHPKASQFDEIIRELDESELTLEDFFVKKGTYMLQMTRSKSDILSDDFEVSFSILNY